MERYRLRPNEKVLTVIRKHAAMLFVPLFFLFCILLLDVFFMPQLFRAGRFGLVFFIGIIALVSLSAARVYLVWHSTHMILTSMRVIDVDRAGFFAWTISEAELDRVQDVAVERHGLLDLALRTGTLSLRTNGGALHLELERVPQPLEVRAEITDAQDRVLGRAAKAEDDVGRKLQSLPEAERRAVGKYVDHLRSKQALENFTKDDR